MLASRRPSAEFCNRLQKWKVTAMSRRKSEPSVPGTAKPAEATVQALAIPPITPAESASVSAIERASTPFFEDRTEEAVRNGIGFALMGPNLSGGSSSTTPTNPEPLAESQIACSTTAQRSEAATPSKSKSKEEESHKLRSQRIADEFVAALNRNALEGTDTP